MCSALLSSFEHTFSNMGQALSARTSKHTNIYSWVVLLFVRLILLGFLPCCAANTCPRCGFCFHSLPLDLLRVSPERSRAHFLFFPLRGMWALPILSLAAGRACLFVQVALGALLCASDPPLLRFHLRRHICVSTPLYYYVLKNDIV